MATPSETQRRIVTRVRNNEATPVKFVLEPWGEIYDMPAAAIFEVVAEGSSDGTLEVEVGSSQITVYGWPGSKLSVTSNGHELTA